MDDRVELETGTPEHIRRARPLALSQTEAASSRLTGELLALGTYQVGPAR